MAEEKENGWTRAELYVRETLTRHGQWMKELDEKFQKISVHLAFLRGRSIAWGGGTGAAVVILEKIVEQIVKGD